MYCNQCGTPIPSDQLVCTACGYSQLDARTSLMARTGVMWVLATLAGSMGPDHMTRVAGPIFFGALSTIFFVVALANLITGWGLLRVRPWGRMLALVMGFIALLHPPFGTALGIYTLYVLLPSDAGAEYDRMAAGAEAQRAATA
jgi:hypothetical protein